MTPDKGPARPVVGSEPVESAAETNAASILPPRLHLAAEPLAVGAREAAALVGVSLRTWRTLDASGGIPEPVRIGRRRLWSMAELRAWAAAGCPPRVRWAVLREAQGGVR